MEMDEIKKLCKEDIRTAKKIMAFEVTKLVHGEEEAIKARKLSEDLFNNNGVSDNMDTVELNKDELDKITLIELLTKTNIISSKSEARRLITQNGISINNIKESNESKIISSDMLTDNYIIIQKGKKTFIKVLFK